MDMLYFKSLRTSAVIIVLALLACLPLLAQTSHAPATSNSGKRMLQDRALFYLDRDHTLFLNELVRREKHLIRLVRNITKELEARGAKAINIDNIPLTAIYGHRQNLVAEYNAEVDAVLHLIADIERLHEIMDLQSGLELLQPLSDLRQELKALFNDWRPFHENQAYSRSYLTFLNREYARELADMVGLYRRFDLLQIKDGVSDEIMAAIAAQKAKLSQTLEQPVTVAADSLYDSYVIEIHRFEQLLREIQMLAGSVRLENSRLAGELDSLKQNLLNSMDARLVAILGQDGHLTNSELAFELFNEWKMQEMADYRVQLMRHRLVKEALLASGAKAERTRMFARDLQDALMSYSERRFEFAGDQLTEILEDYTPYFRDLESIRFYRADCYYQRKLFDLARADYEAVLKGAGSVKHVSETLFRLMLIAERQDNPDDFYRHYELLQAVSGAEDAELLERSHYLAGYVCLRDGRYTKAGESLARIPVNSSYYGPARYLSAMRHLAVANQTAAAEILRELANKTSYPWSQSQSADFRNLARMKLGYLHYENGEYDQAIAYFSMVSPGHSGYQRSLIGRAWAHLKLQHFERSLSLANILIRDHFDSETTYEALVLAAHNKRQLGQEESALNDLRYVTSTKGYLDAAKVFGAERQRLLAQLGELNEMEHAAIVDGDEALVRRILTERERVQHALAQHPFSGSLNKRIITAYLAEGDSLFRALSDWQAMLVAAENAGNTDAAGAASSRIAELNRALTVQQAGLLRQKSRLYRERPLPVREIAAGYNRKLVAGLSDEIETERTALTARLHEIASLKAELGEERQRLQLDVLSAGLASLQRQANRLQSWLATRDTEQPDTDFQNWANISGMGVSDITFNRLQQRDGEVQSLAAATNFIASVVDSRRRVLDQRLAEYEEIQRQLEYEIQQREFERYKQENEAYFREGYFDKRETETPEPKSELPAAEIEPEQVDE